ncbi:MAG TPA: response regulator transcription factor [Candidatus Baltobacteraceae bacterium]|nr:response regulator transcription factor [Candidatus Baltobacteraceae bacterium]
MISVSLVEDHADTRESLAAVVGGVPGFQCLALYASGEEALRGILSQKPDVALVDINLPGMSGIECVAKLKAQLPSLQVLMLTTYAETDLIFNSLRAGANGYLLKNRPAAELISAIEQVHLGGAPMTMQIARKLVEHFQQSPQPASELEKLTKREHEILALLSKGSLYKEISDTLGISVTTVRTHLKHIYEKLHVQSRTEAAVKFLNAKPGNHFFTASS